MGAFSLFIASALVSIGAGLQVQDDIATVHNLTICNAYVDNKPLSVYTVTNKAKLTEEPLEYRACKMISLELAEGERLDFKLGGLSVGTFRASGLPYTTANLLLVPYHRGNGTLSAAFASHAFSTAAQPGAQVAVIDAYAGTASGILKIDSKTQRQVAELKPGSSVSLGAGSYQVSLEDASSKRIKAAVLEVTESSRYVVMRVGSEADGKTQDIVVSSANGNEGSRAAESDSVCARLGAFTAAAVAACLLTAVA
jgi:hypothetical protein